VELFGDELELGDGLGTGETEDEEAVLEPESCPFVELTGGGLGNAATEDDEEAEFEVGLVTSPSVEPFGVDPVFRSVEPFGDVLGNAATEVDEELIELEVELVVCWLELFGDELDNAATKDDEETELEIGLVELAGEATLTAELLL